MAEEAEPTAEKRMDVDDRVGLDSFEFDDEPFITVETQLCLECALKPCLYVCPSKVYRWDGGLVYNTEGCIELGGCFIVCHDLGNKAIRWNYPRGSKGVQFKFG